MCNKTDLILATVQKKGRCTVKFDKASGVKNVNIIKCGDNLRIVEGQFAVTCSVFVARETLNNNSIYIESWL